MSEASLKEKEYNKSIYYLLLFLAVSLTFIITFYKFQPIIYANLDDKMKGVFIFIVNVLQKILIKQYLLEKYFLESVFLFILVLLAITSVSKVSLKANLVQANIYLLFGSTFLVIYTFVPLNIFGIYDYYLSMLLLIIPIFSFIKAGAIANSLVNIHQNDLFNIENETFPQNQLDLENEFSVKFKTMYQYGGHWHLGTVPVINPQRAVMVVGVQGSGKTFSILMPALWQSIRKGYAAVVYDFKFPEMSLEAFNAMSPAYKGGIHNFSVLNFEYPEYSIRCNPLAPEYLGSIDEAAEVSRILLLNLNKTWIKKEGDFFSESAINLLTITIWYLRLMENKYPNEFPGVCSIPHAIEFLNQKSSIIIPILCKYPEFDAYTTTLKEALEKEAFEQLVGQMSSVQSALARLSSPNIYWTMTEDISSPDEKNALIVNDPANPKILCLGNLPEKKGIYGAALSIYMFTIMRKFYNRKGQKTAFFLDELPSIYLKDLDNFINTVRSYNVATWVGLQDFEQLTRDYGRDQADVIVNSFGTIFSGQVNNNSAFTISKIFGKTNQGRSSTSLNRGDVNVSYSQNMQELIPASKITNLSQGEFVGKVADTFNQEINLKLFKSNFYVPEKEMKKPITELPKTFHGTKEELNKLISDNFYRVKGDVGRLVEREK